MGARSLKEFTRDALGHERFTSIDRVENTGWISPAHSIRTDGAILDLLQVSALVCG